ncbi:MAG: DegV family protein [Syntrophomonadales bacterium]|jgi:DegV family protein with EDD domain
MAKSLKIVSDNCCDLPPEILRKYDIKQINMLVRFGDREIKPGEMNNDEFYRNMASSPVLPQTSQPVVEEIIRVYSSLLEEKDTEVIGIHMSSGLSGTVQSVQMVQEMLQQPRLHIIDSLKASMGLGLMVLEAARLADKGAGASTILSRLEEMKSSVRCIFSVQNLEYLISGGRISKGKGLIAGVLNIKPILCIDDTGFIIPYDKARGHRAALKKVLDIMGELGSNLNGQTVGISHAAALDDAIYLKENMEERFGVKEVVIGEIGPVIGSHVGPGTFSIFFES